MYGHDMQPAPARSGLPTNAALTRFLSTLLPLRPRDVPFLYHSPRYRHYNPETALTTKVILSVTPTEGVYGGTNQVQSQPPLVFLHRPFNLDRSRLAYGTTVVSSHTAFDEFLTVGYNTALATRLGLNSEGCECVQGYKGDPERRIGIVGRVSSTVGELTAHIRKEFGAWDEVHGFSDEDHAAPVDVVAIMNAFHAEEVQRVLDTAATRDWISVPSDGGRVLYLTGQARVPGLEAAMKKGIRVVCLGHRTAEEWGIRYLAQRLREQWPRLVVDEVYEVEEVVPRPPKRQRAEAQERESLPPPEEGGTQVEVQSP
ncbi:hypothetical protein B0A49_10216 [Cryomyces minteri]|uniref:Uncharacterized protein n=1 Tax=Cryomyces minteri TaxID=331657 RepID=A0A4U0WVU8_9PEZI|nr:hypothetical protein B0A49_10216 [Cryomyces minteri]